MRVAGQFPRSGYVSAAPIAETGANRVQVRRLATQEVEGLR
jgi:hypothetical protein